MGLWNVISAQNGQAFRILDEQRFAKEILPKYFKHNNLSSFIRQLNMYGFRKVISLESGLFKPDKTSTIEFQHPFFKQGQADLLDHIKRKVSSVRPEDGKLSHDDLHKVLLEVQEMRDEQNNMDAKFDLMKRENKALWQEVSSLRRKHSQQQKLLSKILQFILSLMRRNYIVGVNRKRPLLDTTDSSSPNKYSRHYLHIPVENRPPLELGVNHESSGDAEGVVIQDITDSTHSPIQLVHSPAKASEACPSKEQSLSSPGHSKSLGSVSQASVTEERAPIYLQQITSNSLTTGGIEDGTLELPSLMDSDAEDPDAVINSILKESTSTTPGDLILNREEMQDFLDCIDVSLEELQVLLSKTKYSLDPELIGNINNSDLTSLDASLTDAVGECVSTKNVEKVQTDESEASRNKDKQLMQYMGNTILSLFGDLSPAEGAMVEKDTEDLLRVLQEGESAIQPVTLNPDTSLQAPPPSLNEQVNLLEAYEIPLLEEDINAEYKEPPLFILSPVNTLIEEATEAVLD
ncbi:heat shock factor protein 3-like isoform X2 [Pleurodeles waltl]|uniref:heat shock factor protein 3-like isoform X2 n=1 Tax=Pleurodeles waltl TaxID=8319 RepID=UPI0037094D28